MKADYYRSVLRPKDEGRSLVFVDCQNSFMNNLVLSGCAKSPTSHRHAEAGTGVAPPAVLKRQIAAKRSLAIVAGKTGHSACCRKVFSRRRRTHLTRLRQSRRQPMTVSAVESLRVPVLRVTKCVPKRAGVRSGSRVRSDVVADPT